MEISMTVWVPDGVRLHGVILGVGPDDAVTAHVSASGLAVLDVEEVTVAPEVPEAVVLASGIQMRMAVTTGD